MLKKPKIAWMLLGWMAFVLPSFAQENAQSGDGDGAGSTRPALRLSVSGAVYNSSGSVLVAGRYGSDWGLRGGAWATAKDIYAGEVPSVFIGVDRLWTHGRWRYGLGPIWIDSKNEINGTRWNASLSVAYDVSDRVFVEFIHFSHGSALGIRRNTANAGWNFLGVGIAL